MKNLTFSIFSGIFVNIYPIRGGGKRRKKKLTVSIFFWNICEHIPDKGWWGMEETKPSDKWEMLTQTNSNITEDIFNIS